MSLKNDGDPTGSKFGKLCAKVKKSKAKSQTIGWNKMAGATDYVIYGGKCGTSYKKLAETTGTSYKHSGLAKGTYYKYMVIARKDGKVLAISKLIHSATTGGKVGNCAKIKLNKKSVTLSKGKKFKAKAKLIAKSKKLKIKNHRKVAFESSDTKVATVSKKGVIKAKKKGKCKIFVYAQNGVYAVINVTVK